MNETPFYRDVRIWLLLVAILYTLALIWGTHSPREPWPELTIGRRDKLMHLLAYFGLTLLWSLVFRGWHRPSWAFFAGMVAGIAAFGATDELTQMLVPGRSCELFDWTADIIGMTLGLGVFALSQAIFWAEEEASKKDEAGDVRTDALKRD